MGKTPGAPLNLIKQFTVSLLRYSALVHCNASNLVFEVLKHDNICGTICISSPSLPIRWGLVPVLPLFTGRDSGRAESNHSITYMDYVVKLINRYLGHF